MTEYWELAYEPSVAKWLKKADPQVARKLRDALTAVVRTGEPRSRGKSLTGPLAGLWRYRIGDYRAVCDIQDGNLVVLVIELGHRSDIYT